MQEDPQIAEQRRRLNMPPGFDPRKAVDPAVVEKMVRAQSAVRAQAQAATTVYLATMLSLASSAFGLIAALAWNSAIQRILQDNINGPLKTLNLPTGTILLIYAVIVTLIGATVVIILSRMGRRLAVKSALDQ